MRAALELGHFPAGMEQFAAGDSAAWELIQRVIDESDFYMLIIGGRYGSTDVTGLSFTEREYDYASSIGKPVIPLLHKNPNQLPRQRTETNDASWLRLTEFVSKVQARHTCSFWENPSDLRACAMTGLLAAVQRAKSGGWTKVEEYSPRGSGQVDSATEPNRRRFTSIQDALTKNVESLDRLYSQKHLVRLEGIPTGLTYLDRITGGFRAGEVITIAGRPSMGKTTLGLSFLLSVVRGGLPALVVSPRHSADEISKRLLTLHGHLNAVQVFSGNVGDDDWPKLTSAIQSFNDANVLIDDSPVVSLDHIRDSCYDAKKKFACIPLVLIDSIHYIRYGGQGQLSLGAELKGLARENGAVIIVTSNVNEEPERRPNKRPVLRDLPASTGLADESDILIFMYDDRHYNYDSPDAGTVELMIAKNVLGPIGTVRVKNYGRYHGYGDYTDERYWTPE
jgi:hypothetical protein